MIFTIKNSELTSKDEITLIVKKLGIKNWKRLVEYVQLLPYGRTSSRTNFKLVITEQKGTCSSKHALLKIIADLNGIANIKLILGIYKMNNSNTPKIGNELSKNSIEYIPEAHCYLAIDSQRIDVTSPQSDFRNIREHVIQELEILPEQISEFKVQYHKDFLKNWISQNKIQFNFEEIWQIRENCIKNLTE